MATRAKIRKTYKRHRLLGQRPDFEIISQKCFLCDPFTKIAKIVLLHCTKWPPKTKIQTIKDCLPHLFHGFRNEYMNKISFDNMLYSHN